VNTLQLTGLLVQFPISNQPGAVGIDGKEYPMPTLK